MLRWLVRSTVAGSANSDVKSESGRASRKANDAKRQFDYAKREKDLDKKIVLNSMSLKWNLIVDEFKNLTKKLNFN